MSRKRDMDRNDVHRSYNRNAVRRTGGIWAAGTLLFALFGLLATEAQAQSDRDRDRNRAEQRWDDSRPIAPTPLEESRRAEDVFANDAQDGRVGLFREGSLLLKVPATVRVDEDQKWHAQLHIVEEKHACDERARFESEVVLLPNSFLGELEQVVGATPGQRITFELTGEMFVYAGRNHLLLRAPARVVGLEREQAVGDEDASTEQAEQDAEDVPTRRGGRSAVDVMRDLERESGPLHRAPLVPREHGAKSGQPGRGINGPRSGASGTESGAQRDEQHQWREGAMVIQRRGRVMRDANGMWRFAFEADAADLSDPPLMLLPCLLLERIEQFARQTGPSTAVLITGEVFVHGRRAYLLPGAFQLPRERTPLN